MSLPNQYCAEGSRVRFAGASAVGIDRAEDGAKIAIRTISDSSVPPITMVGLR